MHRFMLQTRAVAQTWCSPRVASAARAPSCALAASRSAPLPTIGVRKSMAASVSAPAGAAAAAAADASIPGVRPTVWQQTSIRQRFPKLTQDVPQCDVCIVGAGIAGLSAAYRLAKAGKQVVVLEARAIGAGMTGRTTAHIMQWNDDYYMDLEKLFGRDNAAIVAQSHSTAVEWIGSVVREEGIDCQYSVVKGYLVPQDNSKGARKLLRQEAACCERLGMMGVKLVDLGGNSDITTGVFSEVLEFPHCADFHPLRYIQGLADAVVRYGGIIYEGTRARASPANGRVVTMDGHTVTAKDGVVLATFSPIDRNLIVHSRQEAQRTYVVGLEVPKDSIAMAQWWDTAEPYHYVRTTPATAGQEHMDILLVGGEDHQCGQSEARYRPPGDAWDRLERYARERWPQCGKVAYRWTGMVYEPADMLGLYGRLPGDSSTPPNYVMTGHSGQGMTGGTIGSAIVADLPLGKPSPWANIYSPSRVPPASMTAAIGLAKETGVVGSGYFSWIIPRFPRDVVGLFAPWLVERSVKNGEGTVVQHGLRKKALYRSKDGLLYKHSAFCTHLGCMVEWNPVDTCFDCKCHGSQFDAYWRCYEVPAVADLEDLGSDAPRPPAEESASEGVPKGSVAGTTAARKMQQL